MFTPRNDHEREACSIEGPKFNVGQQVRIRWPENRRGQTGTVTGINLRTVNYPLWTYELDGIRTQFAKTDLEASGTYD